MDVSAANTPKAAHTRPTGPARPAASVTPNRSNVAGSYSEGVNNPDYASDGGFLQRYEHDVATAASDEDAERKNSPCRKKISGIVEKSPSKL